MVRGRKKDMTIPVSRTIALQRDYRERKARYVADLEDKCRSLEDQNAQLIQEVKELRRMLDQREHIPVVGMDSSSCNQEVKDEALGDIMKTLSAAMSSIQNFQHLAEGSRNSPLINSSASTPPDSLRSSSSLSSGLSSTSASYSAYRAQPSGYQRSVTTASSLSPSVDGYAPNSTNMTPSPSPSFADTTGSQSNYQQQTGNASNMPFNPSDYWEQSTSSCPNYYSSTKRNLRHHNAQELVPPQDGMGNSLAALDDAAKALSDLSSDVLSSHPPFQRGSTAYTMPAVANDGFGGYPSNMAPPSGQPSRMRTTVFGNVYSRDPSSESYLATSG
ncbi:hypothetical protein FB446DRAFT_422122 [Lentinula raphanica]|nr:hypothetical protein FB446DRAFT_422122 [Lentinula raphanica]